MTSTALVPMPTKPVGDFVRAVRPLWDRGVPMFPYDPHAPEAADLLHEAEVDRPIDPSIAFVVMTSGSSGKPKAVMLSREAMEASARGSARHLGSTEGDRWLGCLPMNHIAGLSTVVRSFLAGTDPVVTEGFDVEALRNDTQASLISLVPAMLQRLLDENIDLSRYKSVLLGGSPIPGALVNRATDQGIRVIRTYGMTETAGGCVYDGLPFEGVRLEVRNGIIWIGGEVLASGYRNNDRNPVIGGWLETQDVGQIGDDGKLRVIGRADQLIVSGGYNVAPEELEAELAGHPSIEQVAIAGAQDPVWGQRITAVVVARSPVTLEDLQEFIAPRVSRYKWPRALLLVDSIPRRPSGKIDRVSLAELVD